MMEDPVEKSALAEDERVRNEIRHGEYIREHGEEIWNWSSPAGKRRWGRRCRLFRDFLGNGGRRVLEIGCGTGLFTKELAATGNVIVAIDISEALILKAKKRVSPANVSFVLGNAYGTGFQSGGFDFIVGSSALHHLDVDLALTEFVRLLRPGGQILFTEPNMMNPQVALTKNIPALKRLAGDSPDETAFFRWPLARKLLKAGFVKVSVEPFDFVHPALPASWLDAAEKVAAVLEKTPAFREIAGSLAISGRKG